MTHAVAFACVLLLLGAACSKEPSRARPSSIVGVATVSGQTSGGHFGEPEDEECVEDSVCGNELHELRYEVPNVYFILDRSGSMEYPLEENGPSRYKLVREAMLNMVRSLGPLINVGAALFPRGNIDANPCSAGEEVFAVRPGDPFSDTEGVTTQGLRTATNVQPKGGTPVSPTLEALRPGLAKLEGTTIALLLTDGGPNCNPEAVCSVDECMPAMDGFCAPGVNCCEEDFPEFGPSFCVDRPASVAAVKALREDGVTVYVIGIPGSEYYGALLDEMAEAGGAPKMDAPKYQKVDDLDKLSEVFREIAAEAISCEFELKEPPPTDDKTNVYLDCSVLTFEPTNGWSWKDEKTVQLHGLACSRLKQGKVSQVQIVTGCPTEIPK